MSRGSACSRSWQAEAAEDRRLSDADRASFERHVATCTVCTAAVLELTLLRGLAARTQAPPSSPLEHRRSRNELLRRANELTLAPPRTTSRRGLAIAIAAAAVVLTAVALVARVRLDAGGPAPAALAEPSYELVASPGADWALLERGPALKLAAHRGRFELSVRHLSPGQRFVLILPDGELEVRGTRFVVEVDGTRTLGVRVEEGSVALRVRERNGALLLLGAGERFGASSPAAPPEGAATTPEESSEPAPVPAPRPSVPEASAKEAPGSVAPPNGSAERGGTTDGASGAEFARAMSAFSSGNFGEAGELFRAFAAQHPGDPRAEDATFLSAVASARRGDHENARLLAKRYLARYPNGLRRREAERLAE